MIHDDITLDILKKKKKKLESNIHASFKLMVNNLGLTDKCFSTSKQHPDFLFMMGLYRFMETARHLPSLMEFAPWEDTEITQVEFM